MKFSQEQVDCLRKNICCFCYKQLVEDADHKRQFVCSCQEFKEKGLFVENNSIYVNLALPKDINLQNEILLRALNGLDIN